MSDILTNVNNFMFILIILSNLHNFSSFVTLKLRHKLTKIAFAQNYETSFTFQHQPKKNAKTQKQFKNQNPKTI